MSDQFPTQIWVFSGAKRHFPGGIFTSREKAEKWISKHRLTGTLTLYPVDVGAYEWAIEKGLFQPRKPHESNPEFIGGFSDAGMEHYHYEDGKGGDIDTPQLRTIKKVRLGSHHHASLTKHTIRDGNDQRSFPPFVALEIASYPEKQSCYLFHICADGQGTDTWHESVEEALEQAEWEFGVKPEEWTTPDNNHETV